MLAFVVVVPAHDVELAADRLFAIGVAAVEERASDTDGHVELWTEVGDTEDAAAATVAVLDPSWAWRTTPVDESVAESWRQHAVPVHVTDDVVIAPAWLAGAVDGGAARSIVIDPGAAFGMGDHPTTRLTLIALLDLLAARPASSVLDVGCGSGVLAIAAALHGASPVVAIDIATPAVEATMRNSAANGVDHIVAVSTTPITDVDGRFDIVVANVLAPALVGMAADLRRVVAPGGALVISGILADRHDHVVDALRPLTVTATAVGDGWAAVTLADLTGCARHNP